MEVLISQEDFGSNKSRTYKIKCPGTYLLSENVVFRPKENRVAAILIDSDNVILNLNGKKLKQSHHSKQSRVDGIVVKTGHSNVTILGSYGSVENFSQRGIYVQGGNKNITIGDETLLTVSGCGYGTPIALFDGTQGFIQAGVQLGDMEFFAFPAFKLEDFHGPLHHLKVTNLVSKENCFGLGLGEGAEYRFLNCDFSENYEYRQIWPVFTTLNSFFKPGAVVCYGLVYFSNPVLTPPPNVGITDVIFESCRFNKNVADAAKMDAGSAYVDAFIMAVNFKGLKIRNCQFNSNETRLGPAGTFNQTRGLVLGNGLSTVIEDSEFLNNQGGNYVSGFNLSGLIATNAGLQPTIFQSKSTILRNCVAAGNVASPRPNTVTTPFPPGLINSISSVGFQLRYPAGATLIECIAENNYVSLPDFISDETPVFSAAADGISIYSDRNFPCDFSNNIEIRQAKLSKNRVLYDPELGFYTNLTAGSSGVRVFDDLAENIVIRDSVITNNLPGINENPFPIGDPEKYASAGIDLFNVTEGMLKTGPSFVSITNNEIQSNGTYGVYSNLDFTKIQDNRISYHDFAGVLLDLGPPLVEGGEDQGSAYSSVLNNTFVLNGLAVFDANTLLAEPVSSLVAGNKAFSYPGTGDAYVPSNPPPVSNGTLTAFPPTSAYEWNNVNIENTQLPPTYPDQLCLISRNQQSQQSVQQKGKMDHQAKYAQCRKQRKQLFH